MMSNTIEDYDKKIKKEAIASSDGDTAKVLIIGLGQIGQAVASYVKEQGYDVYGYDINPKAIGTAETKIGIRGTSSFRGFDIYMICVSTHKADDLFSPQIDGLLSVAERLNTEGKRGALVVIESTIPLGTSKLICDILNHNLHVVHAPHRWYNLDQKEHGVNQPRVIGGVHNCCLETGLEFFSNNDTANHKGNGSSKFRKSLGIPILPLSKPEIAELTKIIENAHRYLQIAFAEELFLYCQSEAINFHELRQALNTKWNVNILEPKQGIGGHCLPKDTRMFLNSSTTLKSRIISAAIQADDDYKRYLQTASLDGVQMYSQAMKVDTHA